ncbi:hypothetical protein M0802_015780 [Mischocyttarus mexicanus]|nr:hypothetical protein M0802_015780 [Mischocyttarus mexicanus]
MEKEEEEEEVEEEKEGGGGGMRAEEAERNKLVVLESLVSLCSRSRLRAYTNKRNFDLENLDFPEWYESRKMKQVNCQAFLPFPFPFLSFPTFTTLWMVSTTTIPTDSENL